MRPAEFVPLGATEKRPRALWLAPLCVVIGSMATLLPMVATFPFLPPFGLMFLLAWRLQRADSLKVWAAVPLGLLDDMMSGQPIGSAMLLWTTCFIVIDVLDARLVWRDFWQDWLLASGALGFCLVAGRFVAVRVSAHVDTALVIQVLISCALYPLIARFCARLDRDPHKS